MKPVIWRLILCAPLLAVLAAEERTTSRPGEALAAAALHQVGLTKIYDPAYVVLAYPNGDVPVERGVCADVVVRAFRAVKVDLQVEVHEDMTRHFNDYPNHWGLKKPDRNIDHRRVLTLMKYFERNGKGIGLTIQDFRPGDVVAWRLNGGLYHIGMVSSVKVPGQPRYCMVHNIGAGAQKEDVLNSFRIIGHYRW